MARDKSLLEIVRDVWDEAGKRLRARATDDGAAWTSVHTIVNSADMQAATNISGAPAAGKKLVLTDLVISVGAAMNVTIKEETSGTVVHGPYYMPANSVLQVTTRSRLSKLATADKHYAAVASAAGSIAIETWCYDEA